MNLESQTSINNARIISQLVKAVKKMYKNKCITLERTDECSSILHCLQAAESLRRALRTAGQNSYTTACYCKTLNVSVPFISRAKQNCEMKGGEYQLQAKIGQDYYSISNCMVLICQNKGAKIILHAKSPTFRAAKLKGFTVLSQFLHWY